MRHGKTTTRRGGAFLMSDVSEISIWRVLVAIPVGFVAGIAGLVLSGIVVANIPVFQRIPVIIGVGLVLAVFFTCAGAAALPVLRFRRSKPPAKPAFMDLDESEEREFAAACALLKTSASKSLVNGWLMLVVSAVAFVIWVRMGQNWQVASILFGVVLLHEAGHLAAMRVLGYRDTRILFLPFFRRTHLGDKPQSRSLEKVPCDPHGPGSGVDRGRRTRLVFSSGTPEGDRHVLGARQRIELAPHRPARRRRAAEPHGVFPASVARSRWSGRDGRRDAGLCHQPIRLDVARGRGIRSRHDPAPAPAREGGHRPEGAWRRVAYLDRASRRRPASPALDGLT